MRKGFTLMENKTAKKKLNVVDVAIILLLVLCVVGVALRFVVIGSTPDEDTSPDIESSKYYLSYISREHRYNVPEYIKEGTEFRFYETNDDFGVATGSVDVTNAEKWYYTDNGEYVMVLNDGTDERTARCDIRGTILVEGKYNEYGIFVIDGAEKQNIALGKSFLLRADDIIISVAITDIVPAE